MPSIDQARQVLIRAIDARLFPAAAVEVGSSAGVSWRDALGTLTFDADATAALATTLFDLASLTKVIATTTLVMELVRKGSVQLDEPVASSFPEWRGADRESVTLQDLLEHASGLPARLLDAAPQSRRELEHDISVMPLAYAPRTRSLYSDLDFILLGMLAADRAGRSIADEFAAFRNGFVAHEGELSAESLTFIRAGGPKPPAAPTSPLDGDRRHGRLLAAEVHDEYAAALGGVAGHAGLFGTAAAVGSFARVVLRAARGERGMPPPMSPELVVRFVTKSRVPGSSRALGWDTMLPTSSCGTRMTPAAFGHVGFTGTSVWIDPERDRYFVLLTNRACNGGTLGEMRDVRRAFHDALAET